MHINFNSNISLVNLSIPALIFPYHTMINANPKREQAAINLVQELVRFMSQDSLGIEDVAARIGSIVDDPGIPMPIELRSTLSDIRLAQLSRYPDSGLPYVLTLQPVSDIHLTLTALKAVLGDYKRAATDRGVPPKVLFYPLTKGSHWSVVVIVELESVPDGLETSEVTSMAFRRDPSR
jgi:hypothetical protein